jgi:hypothetical protein
MACAPSSGPPAPAIIYKLLQAVARPQSGDSGSLESGASSTHSKLIINTKSKHQTQPSAMLSPPRSQGTWLGTRCGHKSGRALAPRAHHDALESPRGGMGVIGGSVWRRRGRREEERGGGGELCNKKSEETTRAMTMAKIIESHDHTLARDHTLDREP